MGVYLSESCSAAPHTLPRSLAAPRGLPADCHYTARQVLSKQRYEANGDVWTMSPLIGFRNIMSSEFLAQVEKFELARTSELRDKRLIRVARGEFGVNTL